ncbi:Ig-like domain-containing protein [Granulicella sp. L46]|uniref:beta strand repeat-containing protein n=1 Tax=Granulicella sp. L46 TaxID=1641865 RepID=UPI00131DCA18|nr:Ig-like domain-containing protein [Granulicella sp. L46]
MTILKSIGPNAGIATRSLDQICDSPAARMPVPNIIAVLPKSIAAGANVAANSAIRLKALLVVIVMFLFTVPAFASAPVCMYQDVQSGPATGGEGGNGIYLDIYGLNFGASQGSSTVTVNGTPVAQYLYWGADHTGDRQQIGVQIASGTTGSGQIVVTTPGGSCSNLTFTVRSGHIWFIGPSVDTSAPGNCSTMEAANSYSTPWGLTNFASTNEGDYNDATMRTPETYNNCLALGDTLVFLNGVNYPYFDGNGWHASLTVDWPGATPSSFVTYMARPGATATLGGEGWSDAGIRNKAENASYNVYSGLTTIGGEIDGHGGSGIDAYIGDRVVGNTIECPACSGQAGAMGGGTGTIALGNALTGISTDLTYLPGGSDKQYHDVYFQGNGFEFGWNRIYNTAAYNGFQINEDGSTGFYNFAIHDNDIADVNGSGINLSDIDPSSGYVQVYNNIIHHTGVSVASDGSGGDPHNCIAVKGYGSSTGVGTAEIYNNTMYDCNSYLNTENSSADCAILVYNGQTNVTTNLVNNVVYQPAYTNTGAQNVYICGGGSVGTVTGSNNIWYSAATPGSTAYATAVGTIENPLYVNPSDGAWTNYELQSSSPALGAGISIGPIELAGISNTYLTWDFTKVLRPSPPSIGALESVGTSSGDVITIDVSPNPANLGQSVTLTSTVGQTAGSLPTGTINFMNGSVSLGQASLDSAGTATLTLSTLSAGSYAIVGSYSGDPHYPAGQSAVAPLQVVSTTATSLVASPNPVTAGQTLNLVATVSASGTASLSGTVNFMNGSTVLGSGSVNSSGVATLSISSLPAGTYSLTARFVGNSSFGSSTSAAASVTVNASAATTTATNLIASPNPVSAGQPLNLVATVSASGTASFSGTVNFMNGSTMLGSATVGSSGVATLSTASLPAGTYSLTAHYQGTTSLGASTSAVASVTVNASAAKTTATSLVASPNPVSAGQTLNLVATVSASGTASFSGTVNFMNGSTMLGSGSVNSSGVATLSTASLPAGTYSLTAHYQGTTSLGASTSAVASVIVNSSAAKTTATSLVASPNSVSAGQTLNLVATVSASGTASFSGTVNFMNGSTVLGSGSVSSSGVATLSTASLPAGTYSLTAHYQGTTSLGASTSAAASVTVNASTSTTSIALAATPNPVTEGQALILTATVTENGTAVSTGAVSFMNGSSVLGTAALNSSGVATLSITSLAVGTYSLTAQYPSVTGNNPQGSGSASPASATVLVTVDAATAPIVPSFSMTVSGSTPSVLAGGTAVYSLAVTPTTGTTLPAITFAASGLPTGATATFSPAMIAAGRGTTNVTLSIQTSAAQSARLERTRELNGGLPVVALCLLLLPFGRSSRRFGKRLMRLSSLALLLAGAASLMGLTGCGADVARSTVQSYTVTVTSASASVTQTAQVTLAVE